LKRCIDVSLAVLFLLPALPILLLCAVIVKLDSVGPVLFRQARAGRGFRRFQLLKLRTMEHCRAGSPYTLGEDPRITRAGRWLRRSKLDELPQLWNVLRGDMSLVGPRPVLPQLAEEFRREYKKLLMVRPGLTDPASLMYCRETEILALVPDPLAYFKAVVTPHKLRLSQAYLERANVWRDFAVMGQTVAALTAPIFNADALPEDPAWRWPAALSTIFEESRPEW
jgi:lipopolysaccharide/colanic/teichoic acid biosynthesis glycosyltransferase